MNFHHHLHPRIASGEITVTYRRWSRPQARAGGRYRLWTGGAVDVTSVDTLPARDITDADARASGYDDRDALMRDLRSPAPDDAIYCVRFHFADVADPRIALRESPLTDDDARTLATKLAKMDARSSGRSPHGAWTRATLEAIGAHPHMLSTTLAASLGRERLPFKTDVRKLKALGLTISHEIGYELSPRGSALLDWLTHQDPAI